MLFDALPTRADHAQRMRFVQHQKRTIFFADFGYSREVQDISVHGKNGIAHNQDIRLYRNRCKALCQVSRVIVSKPDQIGPGERATPVPGKPDDLDRRFNPANREIFIVQSYKLNCTGGQ